MPTAATGRCRLLLRGIGANAERRLAAKEGHPVTARPLRGDAKAAGPKGNAACVASRWASRGCMICCTQACCAATGTRCCRHHRDVCPLSTIALGSQPQYSAFTCRRTRLTGSDKGTPGPADLPRRPSGAARGGQRQGRRRQGRQQAGRWSRAAALQQQPQRHSRAGATAAC